MTLVLTPIFSVLAKFAAALGFGLADCGSGKCDECECVMLRSFFQAGPAMQPQPRSRQLFDRDVWEVGQLVVIGKKHVTAEFDCGGKMEGVGQLISLRQAGGTAG